MSIAAALVCLARLLLAAAAMTIVYIPFANFPIVQSTLWSHGVFRHDCDGYASSTDCLARDMHFWWLLACTVAAFGLGCIAALLMLKLDSSTNDSECRKNNCRCCQNGDESPRVVVIGTRMLLPVGTLLCAIARSTLMGPIGEDNVYDDRHIPFVAAYSLLSFAAPLTAAGSLTMLSQFSAPWFLRLCVLLTAIPFFAIYETSIACETDDLICENMLPVHFLIFSAAIMVLSFSEILLFESPQIPFKETICSALNYAGFYSRNGELASGHEQARLSDDLRKVKPEQDILRLSPTIQKRPSVAFVIVLLVVLTGSASFVHSLAVTSPLQPDFDKTELGSVVLIPLIYICTCHFQTSLPKTMMICGLFNFTLASTLISYSDVAFVIPVLAQTARMASWSFATIYITSLIGTDYFAGTLVAFVALSDLMMLGFPTLLALALNEAAKSKVVLYAVGVQCLVFAVMAVEMHRLKRKLVIELIKREALVV